MLLQPAIGVAASLGADFVIIHTSTKKDTLPFIIEAAGTTKVITAGGTYKDQETLLKDIETKISQGLAGAAIDRSIFQHSLEDAVSFSKSLANIM